MDSKSLHYINKQTIRVEIITAKYKIEGNVHVIYNHRASDMLNSKEHFIAVTDAIIYPVDKQEPLFEKDFIAVNKNFIICLTEKESAKEQSS